jgi:predicted nucleic acid-binding protein
VAAILEEHENHDRSLLAYSRANPSHSYCAAHNLAEVYSTLTGFPGKRRLSPDQALLVLDEIHERLTVLSIGVEEYFATVRKFASMGIVGAAMYDGLIAGCALKAKANVLYTLNVRHFMRLGPEIAAIVKAP